MTTLDNALQAFEARRVDAGLEALRQNWVATRSPRVAALLEALSPPPSLDEAEVLERWKARPLAPTATEVPGLLALFSTAGTRRCSAALPVVRAWPPDPRVSRALARCISLERHAGIDAEHDLFEPVVQALEALGDHEAIDLLEAAGRRRATSLKGALLRDFAARLRDRLGLPVAESIGAEALAGFQRFLPSPTSPRSDLETLWSAVYAAPRDLAVRAVLADALSESGDVRGEFIAAQLSPEPKAGPRAGALLRKHWRSWLGRALASSTKLSDVRFEQGFLTRYVARPSRVPASVLAKQLPLGTVRQLEVDPQRPDEDLAMLARAPLCRGLEAVTVASRAQARILRAEGWPSSLQQATVDVRLEELGDTLEACAAQRLVVRCRPEREWRLGAAVKVITKATAFSFVRFTAGGHQRVQHAASLFEHAARFEPETSIGYEDDELQLVRDGARRFVLTASAIDVVRVLRTLEPGDAPARIAVTFTEEASAATMRDLQALKDRLGAALVFR